jgi:hypothetical protein
VFFFVDPGNQWSPLVTGCLLLDDCWLPFRAGHLKKWDIGSDQMFHIIPPS